jgi:hypothetical protein
MKKCPPGVVCVENYSLFFIVVCIFLLFYLIYNFNNKNIIVNNKPSEKIVINDRQRENYGWGISWPYTNVPPLASDPLLNPYTPPLSDERYFVPINVSTNIGAVDTTYRQVGILTPINGKTKDNILALMGRPLFTNRDKWNYYTTSNQHNNVKLPISRNGKSCTNEYGCDRLYNGDTVYIEGINEPYKITIYDNDTIKYLPFF